MCGIVAYVGSKQPLSNLMYLLADNDTRGGHSSGVYIDGKVYKALEKSRNLIPLIEKRNCELFIGHTRYGTHGAQTAENTHPYSFGKYIGVHNGVLQNYEELLDKRNLENVDVDSKAIYSILSATDDYKTLGEHSGTINAVWTESNGQLYVYRRNNPLFRYRNDSGIFFSSKEDYLKLIAHDPAKVKEVTANKLFIYAANGDLIESIEIPVTAEEYVGKNWYDYGKQNSYPSFNYNANYFNNFKLDDNVKDLNEDLNDDLSNDIEYQEYQEIDYQDLSEGLEVFKKAFTEMKYHGWLINKDEIKKIENFLQFAEDEIYLN